MGKKRSLRKLWTNVKLSCKKYRTAVWIELIALLIIFFSSCTLYIMGINRQKEVADGQMDEIQDVVEAVAASGLADGEEVLYKALEAMPHTGDYGSDGCYQIRLQVNPATGGDMLEIKKNSTVVCWQTVEDGETVSQYYYLDYYFGDQAMQPLYDYCGENPGAAAGLVVSEMDGHYQNGSDGKIWPVRVVFKDETTGGVVCDILGDDYENADGGMVSFLAQTPEDGNTDADTVKLGYFSRFIYQPTTNYVYGVFNGAMGVNIDKTDQIMYDGETNYRVNLDMENSQIGSYYCALHVDVKRIARYAGMYRGYILAIALFGEALAIFLILVYLYLKKRQDEAARARETFLNAIAHEMKTPTAVIKNSAECLESGLQPEKRGRYVKMIGQEADHMNALLNNMLLYTRVSGEEYAMKMEGLSLEELSHGICGHYQSQLEEKGISLEWVNDGNGRILADAALMEMVVDNFLSNAVRYCREGGVIRLTMRDGGMRVYNEGECIPEDELEHIWEPLYRSDAARTEEYGRSGMGLAISGAILRMHHAIYGVKNMDGGPEFYFKIP